MTSPSRVLSPRRRVVGTDEASRSMTRSRALAVVVMAPLSTGFFVDTSRRVGSRVILTPVPCVNTSGNSGIFSSPSAWDGGTISALAGHCCHCGADVLDAELTNPRQYPHKFGEIGDMMTGMANCGVLRGWSTR